MKQQRSIWEKIDAYFLQHNVVDTTITLLDSIIFRPVAIAWASGLSLLGTTYLHFVASRSGFSLSGSEVWIFFIAGWCIGVISEMCVRAIGFLIKRITQ